jgi:hypothetical protein
LLDDGRIRIRFSGNRIRIREAEKLTEPELGGNTGKEQVT